MSLNPLDPMIQEIQCNLNIIPKLRFILEIKFLKTFVHVILYFFMSLIINKSEQT